MLSEPEYPSFFGFPFFTLYTGIHRLSVAVGVIPREMTGANRSASHAGSWYSDNTRELDRQLTEWLSSPQRVGVARAIIAPHAGYSYCGETAAYAFKQIVPDNIHRIFILGPSHVAALDRCALTTCKKYKTPLGDLNVDTQVVNDLFAEFGADFEKMDRRDEESEHSLEMQLPFLAKVMQSRGLDSFSIVPILVGSLDIRWQKKYGRILARYLEDPKNLFVISSDFCHWGNRFRYTPQDGSDQPIFRQIERLDRQGMEAIESLNPDVFNTYLSKTHNTICGRNPICVMLQAAEHFRLANNHTHEFKFLRYSQSNQARHASDSSVSYAAGALFIHPRAN
ncbi:unnamed protein product, partial [Mesorhabditis spiculigera]